MSKPLIMLGAGGHASVLTDILLSQGQQIIAVVAPERDSRRTIFANIKFIVDEAHIFEFAADEVLLVNGVGALPNQIRRRQLFEKFSAHHYQFATVVASSAEVSAYATLAAGVQVIHGAIVQAGSTIGRNSIINTAAIVDHDCVIGQHCHIAPRAVLNGQVHCADNVHIGTGSCVLQNVAIGQKALIGVGANVTENVATEGKVYGFR